MEEVEHGDGMVEPGRVLGIVDETRARVGSVAAATVRAAASTAAAVRSSYKSSLRLATTCGRTR